MRPNRPNFSLLKITPVMGVCLLWMLFAGALRAQTPAATFNEGNKLYEQQKFAAAAGEYEKLIQSSNVSSAVYFNLGNAWFKSGQIGRAIAAYRKGRQLAPRDPDIHANLQFARNEANQKAAESLWQQWVHRFTLNEWTIAMTVCIWIFFSLLMVGQWRSELRKSVRLWAASLGVLTILIGVCLLSATRDLFVRGAVVIGQEAVVRRGPFDESQSYFTLRDGSEVTVTETREKWVQVTDASRRTGWLPESQVIVLNGGE